MSGKTSSDFGDWAALWGDAQQKYWQSWLDLTRQATGQPPETAKTPWAQGFELWSKFLGEAAPTETRDWVAKLAEVNKGYLLIGEQIWKMLTRSKDGSADPAAWWQSVSQGLKQMQETLTADAGSGKDPWAGFAAMWGLPLDTWRRVYSACSTLPGDVEKALRGVGAVEGAEGPVQRLLSLPSIGYTREGQEEIQRLQQNWLEHAKAIREYNQVLTGIAVKAIELLGRRLFEKFGKPGETPETLRAFYDLWVDCGEEAYAEAAHKPAFIEAQARLVNTLMAVKRQEQKMVDEILTALNMPTRRELDTSHRRVHELRRQVWKMQQVHDESAIRELREEVAGLQRTVESLRAHLEQAGAQRRPSTRTTKPGPSA